MSVPLEYESGLSDSQSTFAQKFAWVLYDAGNSGFGMIVAGVMFNIFFNRHLTPEHVLPDGTTVHALMIGSKLIPSDGVFAILTAMTAVMVTFAAPVLGAIADVKGWTKRLLVIHATCGSLVSILTAFLRPGDWLFGSILFILAGYFFAGSLAFYNSYIPRLAPPNKQGRLSGAGFAAGYVGGAIALIIASSVIAKHTSTPIGLAFGGVWWFLFSIPAFIFLPSIKPVEAYVGDQNLILMAFGRIRSTFKNIRQYRMLFLFLGAYLLYQNGVDTIIQVAPAYASQVLTNASDSRIQMIFLIVQFVAFPGAILCGYLADKVGNRPVIITTLLMWIVVVALIPLTTSVAWFTVAACVIGLVLGGVQSSSRALMSHLAPPEIRNEAFGFFSVSGKAISIFGPMVYAMIASVWGSRFGVLAVLPFMIAGLLVLLKVKDKPAARGFDVVMKNPVE
ncbi:MAG TPA: MFS transporter [Tepidisphaeraceae bacterium]|nr:MFS transporter [Tepidisphaeraceae bacterium]